VIKIRPGRPKNLVSIPGKIKIKIVSPLQNIQAEPEALPAFY
jgi:hypothetical protein